MGLKGGRGSQHDLNGGDPDVFVKAAGHSKETKVRYCKKVSYREVQESFGRYHSAFVDGGGGGGMGVRGWRAFTKFI